jgi:cob(I)alamin adenosyltransferase
MKIYTKTGDDGSTGLFGGARVDKDDARVEAYGSVDETNALIGMARAASPPARVDAVLARAQEDLFSLGAELACVPGSEGRLGIRLLDAADSERLEREIDAAEAELEPLKSFVLPGGTAAAAALHAARTVCRRAERRVISLRRTSAVRSELIVYLNRLNDLLFVLARAANHAAGVADVPWNARRTSK